MHAMPSWIIHTTFYEETHQSHLRTLAQNTGQTITMLDSIAEIYTWHNGLKIKKVIALMCHKLPKEEHHLPV